jgi:hypothetical protein
LRLDGPEGPVKHGGHAGSAARRICTAFRTGYLHLTPPVKNVYSVHMRIAKPILLVSTPLGVAFGLVEGYRLAGGLVVLMAAMLGVVFVAAGTVMRTVRREQLAERARNNAEVRQCPKNSRSS